jgi:hypothetical protein
MAKVLSERDKIKERHEQAMKLLVERGREIDFLKNENKVLKERFEKTRNTALILKKHLDEGNVIDVGLGVEADLGVSRTKLKTAIHMLEEEGYQKFFVKIIYLK